MQRGNIKFPSLRSVVPAIFAVFKKRPHGGENRLQVLADYYRTSTDFIAQVQNFSPDKDTRRDNAKAHGINPHILRTMLDYTHYPEAEMLLEALATVGVGPKELRVLDFGCLVADYGITFARRKARVTIYDYQEPTDFAKFRFAREHLPVEVLHVPDDYPRALTNKDLVIFGEVLEHLENPLQVLQECAERKIPYIFTSKYPYGDNTYFKYPGHTIAAQQQQPESLRALRASYQEIELRKFARLWKLKKTTSPI